MFPLKMVIFHCYVSLPECIYIYMICWLRNGNIMILFPGSIYEICWLGEWKKKSCCFIIILHKPLDRLQPPQLRMVNCLYIDLKWCLDDHVIICVCVCSSLWIYLSSYHLPIIYLWIHVNPMAWSCRSQPLDPFVLPRDAAGAAASEGARLGLTCQGTITCRSNGGDRREKT